MKKFKAETGFTYIEVIISMVVLVIGILAALSALTFGIISTQGAEKKDESQRNCRFNYRNDFCPERYETDGSISNWDSIQTETKTNNGIFLPDWTTVRESPGADGIYGTADDACPDLGDCVINGTTNNSLVLKDYERKIDITDINENGAVRKRLIDVTIRYYIGTLPRQEKISTIIANMPFD